MKIVFRIILAITLTLIILISINPLRWPEKLIRLKVLSQVPLGSSIEEVRDYAKKTNANTCDLQNTDNVNDKISYYNCDLVSYEEMCQFNGGILRTENNVVKCELNKKEIIINQQKTCYDIGGRWIVFKNNNVCIGNKIVNMNLGEYWILPPFPLVGVVIATFKFDKEKKLTDIVILKSYDGT